MKKLTEEERKQKEREQQKKYYQKKRKKILKKVKEYCEKNKDLVKERKRKWYQKNKEKISTEHKKYRKNNQEKLKEKRRLYNKKNPMIPRMAAFRRRARHKNAPGFSTKEQIQARFDYYGNKCYYCGDSSNLQMEHRIPLSRGGSNWPANIVPACRGCNSKKSTQTEAEFNRQLFGNLHLIH